MTIALINKQPLLLSALSLFLKTQFNEVTVLLADNINTLNSFSGQWPDLFIMGFGQNTDADNLEFLSRAKKRHSIRTIAFDERPDYSRAKNYLQTGVNGYLSKQNNLTELGQCVKQVLKGHSYICSEVSEQLNKEKKNQIQASSLLTVREFEIAVYLTKGMKTSAIANKLGRKSSTVSTIKNNIFRKLHIDNVIELRHVLC